MRDSKIYQIILQKFHNRNHILDVGCGDGYLVNFLAKRTKKTIIGLDIKCSGFKKAFHKAKGSGTLSLVKCVKGDAHRATQHFPYEKFEGVIMMYTLHHLKQPVSALKEIRNILQPHGQLLIVDWVFYQNMDKGECRKYSVEDMLQMTMEAGYSPIRVEDLEPGLLLVTAGNNYGEEASA